jgi:hypothetical protein
MRQARQDAALAPEALLSGAAEESEVQQLHGDLSLEASVAAPREPDRPHAAVADGGDERVGAERPTCERGLGSLDGHVEKRGPVRRSVGVEEHAQVLGDFRRLGAE